MTDSTNGVMTKTDFEMLLRSVMGEVVTLNMVQPLVERAVDNRMEITRERISAIDDAQRRSFQDFKETADSLRRFLQQFQEQVPEITKSIGALEQSRQNDSKRISDLMRRVEHIESESSAATTKLGGDIAALKEQVGDLKADIHGDKENTTRPSVFSLLDKLDKKMDTISGVQAQQADYINKRRGIESAIFSLGSKAVGSTSLRFIVKWALVGGLGGGALMTLARAVIFVVTGQ